MVVDYRQTKESACENCFFVFCICEHEQAHPTGHSTATMAAAFATHLQPPPKVLWLTHFSARYSLRSGVAAPDDIAVEAAEVAVAGDRPITCAQLLAEARAAVGAGVTAVYAAVDMSVARAHNDFHPAEPAPTD